VLLARRRIGFGDGARAEREVVLYHVARRQRRRERHGNGRGAGEGVELGIIGTAPTFGLFRADGATVGMVGTRSSAIC
jgi:hypothetical protein